MEVDRINIEYCNIIARNTYHVQCLKCERHFRCHARRDRRPSLQILGRDADKRAMNIAQDPTKLFVSSMPVLCDIQAHLSEMC